MNNRFFEGGTFRNLQKAFDCVKYGIVVDKLGFVELVRIFCDTNLSHS